MSRVHGGTPPTDLLLRLVEILEDGEWHDVDEVTREVGKLIPPGRAMRAVETRRQSNKPRQRPLSTERAVESGRRHLVRALFSGRPGFELDPKGNGGMRRIKQSIRMTQMPQSVVRHRAMEAEGRVINDALLDALIASADPRATLAPLRGRRHLEDVIVALLKRVEA